MRGVSEGQGSQRRRDIDPARWLQAWAGGWGERERARGGEVSTSFSEALISLNSLNTARSAREESNTAEEEEEEERSADEEEELSPNGEEDPNSCERVNSAAVRMVAYASTLLLLCCRCVCARCVVLCEAVRGGKWRRGSGAGRGWRTWAAHPTCYSFHFGLRP